MTTAEKLNKLEKITQEQQEIGKNKLQQQGRFLPIGNTIEDVMDNIPAEDDYYTKNEINYLLNQTQALIPDKVSELQNDAGYTNNTGTVTGVKVGDTTYQPTGGIVELPESSGGAQIDDEHVSTTTTYSSSKIESLFELPLKTFGGCTDEELVEIIAKADAGELNPSNYWAVGDRRSITLSAMATYGDLPDTHASQAVDLVIWHVGLYRDTNDKVVNFVVGFATPLIEQGVMNSTSFRPASWHNCERRQWCNNTLYNAIPQSIRSIFKQFKVTTGTDSITNDVTIDISYFSLPAEKEIIGNNRDSVPAEANLLTLFSYFETSSNRNIKINGISVYFWERSPIFDSEYSSASFCGKKANTTDSTSTIAMDSQSYIVPFGCI